MNELKRQDIVTKFGTIGRYDKFRYQWAIICARLNPTKENRQVLESMIYEKEEEDV